MTLTLCMEDGCGAAMELREDQDGPFYHCRNCGADADLDHADGSAR